MPRYSEETKKLQQVAAQRSKCFGACNVHATTVCGICQSYADCLLVTPTLNKGYDPQQPEVEGQNEASYIYPINEMKKRTEVEKAIVKLKAAAAGPAKPAREAQPAEKPKREATPPAAQEPPAETPAEPAGDVDDILSEIDNLAGDVPAETPAEPAAAAEPEDAGPSLDDLVDDETAEATPPPVEEPAEVPAEPAPEKMDAAVETAAKKQEKKAAPPELTGDVEVAKYFIDYFFDRLEGVLSMFATPGPKLKKPIIIDVDTASAPALSKPGRRPGPKAGAAKKKVAKKKGGRKPGPKSGKKKK